MLQNLQSELLLFIHLSKDKLMTRWKSWPQKAQTKSSFLLTKILLILRKGDYIYIYIYIRTRNMKELELVV